MADRYAAIHRNPQGPGDARPTAIQIIQDEGAAGKSAGKTILITGCSSGLGVETAKALFLTGATLYLTARDVAKMKTAIGASLATSDRVHLIHLDLNSLANVRAAAQDFLARSTQLNVLIANAGIMATPEGRTADGFELQFGTNHLAHFLLIQLLTPILITSAQRSPNFASRVVILSSIAHRFSAVRFDNLTLEKEYDPNVAYGQSKTANLWTANEFERRHEEKSRVHAWSVQPGGVAATGLLRHTPEETKAVLQQDKMLKRIFKTPEQGAATTVWAAVTGALEGMGGKYLEDVQIAKPYNPEEGMWAPGYAPHAYSPEKEGRLWNKSLELVDLPVEA